MSNRTLLNLMAGASLIAVASAPAAAWAQSTSHASRDDTTVEEVTVVSGRRPGVMNLPSTGTVNGLNMALEETPRSVTTVDASLLKDLQVRSIHDLTQVSPGVYTTAYFGVAGAIQIRGNVADNYYRGFKGVSNAGYYETPTQSVSNMEIVRGPVSPNYGAGKVGGMLNLTPKTDVAQSLKFAAGPRGLATVSVGSYDTKEATIEGGVPFTIGGNRAALYGFVYAQDSGSFYRHFKPKDHEFQVGYSMELGSSWTLNAGIRYLDSKGHLAAPGWNRLTQDLIDNGNYLSGQALIKLAKPGSDSVKVADIQPFVSSLRITVNPAAGNYGRPNNYTMLDPATVKLVQLSMRNINTSRQDFNDNTVGTGYIDLIKTLSDTDSLKFQGFFETLENDMFSAAGSATLGRVQVAELRATYLTQRTVAPWLSHQSLIGVGYRRYDSKDYQNYGRKFALFNRNDLSAEPTADMIINNWSTNPDPNKWDFRYYTVIESTAAFANTDITLFDNLHLIAGGRIDKYEITASNRGLFTFGGLLNTNYSVSKTPATYSVSLNYHTPVGIIPYLTYAENKSLETNKGGGIDPSLLIGRNYLSPSSLSEAGVKGNVLGGKLYFSLAAYRQARTQRDGNTGALFQIRSKGVEAEARWAVTPNLDLLATVTSAESKVIGATSLALTVDELGLTGQQVYAGQFNATTGNLVGSAAGYIDTTQPKSVISLFGIYRLGEHFEVSGGGNYIGKTEGLADRAVVIKAYTLYRASVSFNWDRYTVDLSGNNLTDERYFILGADAYADTAALPGVGRTFNLRLAAKF